MLNPSAKAASAVQLLPPVSTSNTALRTGGWVDCRKAEGDIMITQDVGACTGTLTGTFETAPYANGTGNVALTPPAGALVAVSAANNTQIAVIPASQNLGWIKYIGTVGTGPSLVGVTAHFHPKYTT